MNFRSVPAERGGHKAVLRRPASERAERGGHKAVLGKPASAGHHARHDHVVDETASSSDFKKVVRKTGRLAEYILHGGKFLCGCSMNQNKEYSQIVSTVLQELCTGTIEPKMAKSRISELIAG